MRFFAFAQNDKIGLGGRASTRAAEFFARYAFPRGTVGTSRKIGSQNRLKPAFLWGKDFSPAVYNPQQHYISRHRAWLNRETCAMSRNAGTNASWPPALQPRHCAERGITPRWGREDRPVFVLFSHRVRVSRSYFEKARTCRLTRTCTVRIHSNLGIGFLDTGFVSMVDCTC